MGRVHLGTASGLGVVFVDFVDVQTDHSAEDGEDLWLFIWNRRYWQGGSRSQTASEGVVGSIPGGAKLVHDARGNDTAISKYANNADMSDVFIGGNPVVSDCCGG